MFDVCFGTTEAEARVYVLNRSIDFNNDGLTDFIYSSEDDTYNDYTLLLQKEDHFKAVFLGSVSDLYSLSPNCDTVYEAGQDGQLVSYCNPEKEVFTGNAAFWIGGNTAFFENTDVMSKCIKREIMIEFCRKSGIQTHNGSQWMQLGWFGDQYSWIHETDFKIETPVTIFR